MEIRLEPLERTDFPVIRDWIDPRLFRIFEAPIDDAQLERLLPREEQGRPVDLGFKAVQIETGSILGFVHAVIDWKDDLVHIQQIIVSASERRGGIGTRLMDHLLAICFTDLGLHRAQLFVDEDNEPAVAFYRKLGFRTDGLMRDAAKVGSTYKSWYCLSILEDEWPGGVQA
jgi:RimJ/RimL family protein N-acetyltransferase